MLISRVYFSSRLNRRVVLVKTEQKRAEQNRDGATEPRSYRAVTNDHGRPGNLIPSTSASVVSGTPSQWYTCMRGVLAFFG